MAYKTDISISKSRIMIVLNLFFLATMPVMGMENAPKWPKVETFERRSQEVYEKQRAANAETFYQIGSKKKAEGDIKGAIIEFRRAANHGHKQAQRELDELAPTLQSAEESYEQKDQLAFVDQNEASANAFYQIGLDKQAEGDIEGAIIEFRRAANYGHKQAQHELDELDRTIKKPETPQVTESAMAPVHPENASVSSGMEHQENPSSLYLKNSLIATLNYFVEKEGEYRKLLLEGIDVFSGDEEMIKYINETLENKEDKETIDTFFNKNFAFTKNLRATDQELTARIKSFFNNSPFSVAFKELWNTAFHVMNKKLKNKMDAILKTSPQYEPQNFDEYMMKVRKRIAKEWVDSNYFGGPKLDQGFKLHISATPESALRVFLAVKPILDTCHFYKMAGSLNFLEYINQHYLNQRGKFITVYPESEEDAQRLAVAFNNALIKLPPEDFIQIPSDHPLGDSGGLYARYGGFTKDYLDIIDQNGNLERSSFGLPFTVKDDRDGPWKPDFVTWDPFESLEFEKRK